MKTPLFHADTGTDQPRAPSPLQLKWQVAETLPGCCEEPEARSLTNQRKMAQNLGSINNYFPLGRT